MKTRLLLVLTAAAALSACAGSEHEEINRWMAEQRAVTKPQVRPIPEPKKFTPQDYTQETGVEPFSQVKLTQALKRDAGNEGPEMTVETTTRRAVEVKRKFLDVESKKDEAGDRK